ncbi:MAG: GFA family protein [Gammaproteobacteria bacterium]
MRLEGSCHCGRVGFRLESAHPYPFNLCYCSICRKTAGGGGFAINLGGDAASFEARGEEHLTVYRVRLDDGSESPCERRFCRHCGSALWAWDPRWPELIHPFASAVDTPLPVPPERTHLMLGSRAAWVEPAVGAADRTFDEYPEESIAEWHRRLGLER